MKTPIFALLLWTAPCFTACLTEMLPGDETCFDYVEVAPREPGRVQYTVPVVDFDTQLTAPIPVPGAVLTVCTNSTCEPALPACATEVNNGCYREFPGPNPAIRVLDFPYGLTNVTLRWTAPGYIPTDYPMGGPLVGSPDGELAMRGVGIVLVKESTYAALHGQVGGVPDPARGTLAVRVLDCGLGRAPGNTVEPYNANLAGSTAFSLSSNNLASGSDLTTDARGVVGFFNLPPQTIDVHVADWGFQPTTFNVRPGTLTLGELRWGLERFGQ